MGECGKCNMGIYRDYINDSFKLLFLALLCWINYSGQILLHTWLKESKNAQWRTHCALLSYGTNYISHTMIHGQFANGKNLFHSFLRINPPPTTFAFFHNAH